MKKIFFLLISAFVFTSCTKEDSKPYLQSHDEDEMMSSLHELIENVDTISFSKGLELDFIDVMQALHHGGLDMANIMFHDGKDTALMHIAEGITLNLHALLYDLTALDSVTVHNDDTKFQAELKENLEQMSKVADIQLITGDLDNDYATLMIPHHQLIIATCNSYLNYSTDSSFRNKVQEIIDLENTEIFELTNWLISNKR